jgi:nitroreductase
VVRPEPVVKSTGEAENEVAMQAGAGAVQAELYQAILARCSVRRYDDSALDEDTLTRIRALAAGARPLIAGNLYETLIGSVTEGTDLVATLGAYGRIVNPPHYLLSYVLGGRHPLEDLGYRSEQVAVRLTEMGLGSCFIGCLGREEAVRARFSLPGEARMGAFLVFGRPSASLGGQAANRLMRAGVGATSKLPAARLFYRDTFAAPTAPPPDLTALIEAARRAPSAVNAQPWRFLWDGERLYLFVKRRNPRYGGGAYASYNLYDGGICMGNVSLALEALGMEGHWTLHEATEPGIPEHPAELLPLASLAWR